MRPGIEVEMTREPVGVVAMITPWNFPLAIPAWKIAPALAFGNCVVFKPAELVPGCAWAIAEIISRTAIPPGVFNLVMGRGSVVGDAFVKSPDVDAISFTGSVPTGKAIARTAIESMKKLQLEMGGKNPQVVLDDANLDVAVNAAVQSAFYSTGQRCTASSRIIVTAGIHDRFVNAMVEQMKALRVDDALKADTQIGPVVDQSQLDQDLSYVDVAQKEGGKLAAGGVRLKRATEGFYMAPALITETTAAMRINREEVFGPGRQRHQGPRLRRGAGGRQRHAVRPHRRHLHDIAQARVAFQAPRAGRHGDGQPADRRRRLPRAVRRPQGIELRAARTGDVREGVLHDREDDLRESVTHGRAPAATTIRRFCTRTPR